MSYNFSGNIVTVVDSTNLRDKLVGTYSLKNSPMSGFYLQRIEDYSSVKKMYGNSNNFLQRISRTFLERKNSTGVVLCGEKGSGKSLLAKELSIKMREEHQIPTIIVNEPYSGEGFNTFIASINQPCVVIFDEFEKVYDEESQSGLLTLFDGLYPMKKLFILTLNQNKLVDAFNNRPGRFYYSISFKGLDEQFIREYCDDCLVYKERLEEIVEFSKLFMQFNFDMLQALVEEINRYNESPKELHRVLNTKPETSGFASYDLRLFDENDKEIELENKSYLLQPSELTRRIEVSTSYSNRAKKHKDQYYIFENKDLVEFRSDMRKYQKDGLTLTAKKSTFSSYGWDDF